ncbi:MAG: hypothetical protein BGP06_15860 [Rhizobiales bacterium 65-9]|nr:hypothetical protein [Hyphomicrobiales bacterium]OJY37954.1 MAG: hypothetical protein BGP06_15860 [Rhizobiales bacterium 65-9]
MFDPRRPTLRYRLDKGETLGVVWLSLGSVALCELAARSRPDAIVLDMQHGLWDRLSMENAIGATPSDIPVMIRIAENTPLAIGQALDAGAEGVIVPLVETAKQARAAVAAAHYPPRGRRSGGGVRPLADFVDYVDGANRGVVVCVMIETEKGRKNARKIAAVEGVDMVFIGTGDLALSIGCFPQIDARHEQACLDIQNACRSEWTLCGTFTNTVDGARAKREQGFRMVVTANDGDLVARGFNHATTQFNRPSGATPLPPAGARQTEGPAP